MALSTLFALAVYVVTELLMVTKRQLDRFNYNLAQVIKDIITLIDKKKDKSSVSKCIINE